MNKIEEFGRKLRGIRLSSGESLALAAKSLDIDRSTLNKIELGQYIPRLELLNRILSHFSIEGSNKSELLLLAGLEPEVKIFGDFRGKEVNAMDSKTKIQNVTVNLDPVKVPVLFTDGVLVTASEHGMVLDVTQRVGGSAEQINVVSRIGMSFDHARRLMAAINDQLEKNER